MRMAWRRPCTVHRKSNYASSLFLNSGVSCVLFGQMEGKYHHAVLHSCTAPLAGLVASQELNRPKLGFSNNGTSPRGPWVPVLAFPLSAAAIAGEMSTLQSVLASLETVLNHLQVTRYLAGVYQSLNPRGTG